MKTLSLMMSAAMMALALPAYATIITNPSLVTSADRCYLGCTNNPANRHDHGNILDGDWGQTGNTGFNSWNESPRVSSRPFGLSQVVTACSV